MMKPVLRMPVALLLLIVATACVSSRSRDPEAAAHSAAERLLALRRPLVIAHRGYSQLAPENTLPAFRLARIAGADLIELDYRHTRDGVPLVIHDATVERTTDAVHRWKGANLRVDDRTAAELQTLDAGSWFDPPYPRTQLPTLAEALDQIQAGGVALVERKAGDAAAFAALLERKNLLNGLIVQSFDWQYLCDLHALAPAQILGALGPPEIEGRTPSAVEGRLSPAWIDAAKQCGARIVVWHRDVSRAAIAHAHRVGLEVWVYTIDDPAVAMRLLDLGVDGIITNDVAAAWRAIALHLTRK